MLLLLFQTPSTGGINYIKFGSSSTQKFYVGSTQVSKIYLGTTLVYQS